MVQKVSRRARFTAVRRRRSGSSSAAALGSFETGPEIAAGLQGVEPPAVCAAEPVQLWHAKEGLRQIAQLLWLPCYGQLFQMELLENERALGGGLGAAPVSSYRARLKGEPAELYDKRRMRQRRDALAVELHAANQQRWSPSLIARTIAYHKDASGFIRRIEGGQRRIGSTPIAWESLRLMRDCEPQPAWARGKHVRRVCAHLRPCPLALLAVVCDVSPVMGRCSGFDQTYEWVGMQKHGQRSVMERVDAQGMPIQIKHEVREDRPDTSCPLPACTHTHGRLPRLLYSCGGRSRAAWAIGDTGSPGHGQGFAAYAVELLGLNYPMVGWSQIIARPVRNPPRLASPLLATSNTPKCCTQP